MNMQRSQNLTGRAVAFLSVIAASSLLGLPALAGGIAGTSNKPGGQAPVSSDQMQCMPTTQSNSPSSTAAPDASATGAEQLPNQADPRTGVASSDQTANGSADGSMANAPSVQTTKPSNVQTTKPSKNQPGTSNANRGTATMGNMSAPMNSNNSMRSSTMSRSSSQSSQTTAGMMSNPCPSGTMPRSSTPASRQAPDRLNPGMRPSSQPTDSQMRQSPADDNGSRAR